VHAAEQHLTLQRKLQQLQQQEQQQLQYLLLHCCHGALCPAQLQQVRCHSLLPPLPRVLLLLLLLPLPL
jgi:hypothetical protein